MRTALILKSIIFWDVTLCRLLCCNRRFGGTYLEEEHSACHLLTLLVLAEIIFFDPEDGGDMFLRNIGRNSDYTASHPRR
jgi:hypothetical protein